jgi:uncharacterized protein YfbU (UPF0304 family)
MKYQKNDGLNTQVAMTSTFIRMMAVWNITTACRKERHPVVEAEGWVHLIITQRPWV